MVARSATILLWVYDLRSVLNKAMNLAQLLSQTATKYADKTAIAFADQVWTYRDFDQQVRVYAAILQQIGIHQGDRVAVQLPKSVEFLCIHFAILAIGAIALPLNPDYRAAEINYFLTDSGSALLVTTSDRLDHLQDMPLTLKVLLHDTHKLVNLELKEVPNIQDAVIDSVQDSVIDLAMLFENFKQKLPDGFELDYGTGDDDIAMICYTSGTTGQPKGAMLSHRNLIANTQALYKAWQWSDRDRLLHVLPLFHVHGLNVAALGSLYAGATMIMIEKFQPQQVWQMLESEQCTLFMAVPTIYQLLINRWSKLEIKPNLDKMRIFISGSAPLSDRQFQDFAEITGFPILERYGMTETGMNASNPIAPELRISKSVGFPLQGVEIRIVNQSPDNSSDNSPDNLQIGEVWIRGENVFCGYWQRPAQTAQAFTDGWFHTGDLGYLDDGRLYLVGRAKELIITCGFNVYPKEIENVIDRHELVKESAVFGLPDANFGEKVVAAIALQDDAVAIDQSEITKIIIKHCKKELASYKCPKQIFVVSALPRNAMGKLQKHILANQIQ
jgi:malonyl-CoA/methylmalonyl-CoA synthetase